MDLQVLGSSSAGNCYILTDNRGQSLIIEAGLPVELVSAAIGAADIAGVLVTHRHGDHSKYVPEWLKRGRRVYGLADVLESHKIKNSPFFTAIEPTKGLLIGHYSVIAFSVEHDVPCVGFYIHHSEIGNLVFLTDFFQSEYVFPDVNFFMVEANYDEALLESNRELHGAVKARIRKTHASIETTKELLLANDLTAVGKIILIHLSEQNSDAEAFQKAIAAATGKDVRIADTGLEIKL